MTRHPLGWPAAAVAAAAALGFYAAFVVAPPGSVYFGGDQARLFDQASQILHGHLVYTGPYSKGDRFHPGPAYFYLLAAVYAVGGGSLVAATMITSAVKAVTLAALALVAYRLFGSLALAFAAPFTVAFSYWFVLYLKIEWNPAIVLPFLAIAIWAAVEAAAGSAIGLVACGLALSVAAQSHVAVVPLVVVLAIGTVVAFLKNHKGSTRGVLWTAGLASAVIWLPVGLDVVLHQGGNPLRLVRDLGGADGHHSLQESWTVARSLAAEALPFEPDVDRLVLATSAGLLAAGVLWWRGRRPLFAWFAAMLAGLWVAFVWSVSRIPEQIETYYLVHLWLLVALTLIGGAGVLVSAVGTTRRRREIAGGLLAAMWLAAAAPAARQVWQQFAGPRWNDYPLDAQQVIVRAIDAREPAGRPVPIDYYPALNGFSPSFAFLLSAAGHEPQPHQGIGAYRVLTRSAYDELGGSPVDGGRELLKNASYVLEYIPNR